MLSEQVGCLDLVNISGTRADVPENTLERLPRVLPSTLRRQGVSLQHIRKIIAHLRGQGYESPLREVRVMSTAS